MLKAERISTSYGDVQAIREVSFSIEEGRIVSIIGSNGAGKSTTLNTLSGVIRCRSGEIEFLGRRIEHLPPHDIVELGLIQIPEARLLFPYMTVLENLELGSFAPQARVKRDENLKKVLELFPILGERQKQVAGTLSGGEQQMLAIARGLMSMPKLLMLDEPSLGLAPIVVEQVFEIVQKINRQRITILLVEQNVFQTLAISDWVYVLENGSIVLEGEGKKLLDNPQVKEAYMGI
jgi:branched-chain amino acid transport system ATP-binding protein